MRSELEKGKLTAILDIQVIPDSFANKKYLIHVQSSSATGNSLYLFLQSMENMVLKVEAGNNERAVKKYIVQPEIIEGQKYRQIDFILPGQLGFSILFATLFGMNLFCPPNN
jgi:ABC-2 type transport system permease protein